MTSNNFQDNKFIPVAYSTIDNFDNNNIIEGFYDFSVGKGKHNNLVSIKNQDNIIKSLNTRYFVEGFTDTNVKGKEKTGIKLTKNKSNKKDTFANYPYGNTNNHTTITKKKVVNSGNPIYTVINKDKEIARESAENWCEDDTDNAKKCGVITVSKNKKGSYSANVFESLNGTTVNKNDPDTDSIIVNGESDTFQINQSDYNKEPKPTLNAGWSANTTLIPDDLNYTNPQGPESKPVLPLPEQCYGQGLDPYQPVKIVNETAKDKQYIYVDGRKMKLSSDAIKKNNCYAAKYWIDPKTKSDCRIYGKGSSKCGNMPRNSKAVTSDCFAAIPTAKGVNTYDKGAIDCQSDIRPSQRASIANDLLTEANKYRTRGSKSSLLYNTKSAIVSSKYGEIEKVNSIISKQIDDSDSNSFKLEKLNNSIYSQQRQVQISNDETSRRDENLFLLKILLTYLLIISIPLIIKRQYKYKFKFFYPFRIGIFSYFMYFIFPFIKFFLIVIIKYFSIN